MLERRKTHLNAASMEMKHSRDATWTRTRGGESSTWRHARLGPPMHDKSFVMWHGRGRPFGQSGSKLALKVALTGDFFLSIFFICPRALNVNDNCAGDALTIVVSLATPHARGTRSRPSQTLKYTQKRTTRCRKFTLQYSRKPHKTQFKLPDSHSSTRRAKHSPLCSTNLCAGHANFRGSGPQS